MKGAHVETPVGRLHLLPVKRRGPGEQALRVLTRPNKVCLILQENCYFVESFPPLTSHLVHKL